MKICKNCGACNGDERRNCIDCGDTLGEKLTAAEEKERKQGVREKIERLYNKRDPLYVSIFDKIMGAVAVFGAVATIVLIAIFLKTDRTSEVILLGLATFVLAAVEAFFPKFTWALEKWRMSRSANGADDITPSFFYFWSRKISIVLCVLYGIVVFAVSIL